MIDLPAGCRPATPDDADALAQLVNLAGEGLPLHLWERMAAPGQSPWDVGRARARRDTGGFSWRNATVREAKGRVVADASDAARRLYEDPGYAEVAIRLEVKGDRDGVGRSWVLLRRALELAAGIPPRAA